MAILRVLLMLALLGGAGLLLAGQLGWLRGTPPDDLGVRDGRLRPPSKTDNSVSSQADLYPALPGAAYARIEALPARGSAAESMRRLRTVIETLAGARVIEAREDYLYVQFTTRWLKFVDDAEFWFDPGSATVQLRSASRIGRGDLGVNRARIEVIRRLYAAP